MKMAASKAQSEADKKKHAESKANEEQKGKKRDVVVENRPTKKAKMGPAVAEVQAMAEQPRNESETKQHKQESNIMKEEQSEADKKKNDEEKANEEQKGEKRDFDQVEGNRAMKKAKTVPAFEELPAEGVHAEAQNCKASLGPRSNMSWQEKADAIQENALKVKSELLLLASEMASALIDNSKIVPSEEVSFYLDSKISLL